RVVRLEAGLELAPALQAARERLFRPHTEQRRVIRDTRARRERRRAAIGFHRLSRKKHAAVHTPFEARHRLELGQRFRRGKRGGNGGNGDLGFHKGFLRKSGGQGVSSPARSSP